MSLNARGVTLCLPVVFLFGSPVLFGCAVLSGCAVGPYEAGYGVLPEGELPADAFLRVCEALQADFPELVEIDEDSFRVQSAWTPHERPDAATQARLSLWREDRVLRAVVEVRVLRPSAFGVPQWDGVEADPAWERRILDRAVDAVSAF